MKAPLISIERSVTADRVLANTFYLYYPGYGVFETTNGGVSWTNVYSGNDGYGSQWNGYITAFDWYNNEIMSVPGEAGNLFFTGGYQSGTQPDTQDPFMRSTNGGATWIAVPNVLEVSCFGFGAAAPGQSYPSIYIVGYVNSVYGIWQSTNNAQSWTQIGVDPNKSLDTIKTISGDPNVYGQVYVGFQGSGYAVLVAPPSVVGVTATGAGITNDAGTIGAGAAVTFTVSLTATVTVAGGAPTLSLNDGGTATYVSGSGTNALVFIYTVGSGQSASGLAITGINLPSGVTIQDDVATAAVFTGAKTTFTGLTVVGAGGSAPTITGTVAGRATTSEAAVKPFSGVTIADANSGASDTLTITVTGAGGTLSGTGLTGGTGGVYTLTGTAAAITGELDALSFTPKAGSPGTGSTTNFRLSDLSSAYATATVNTTTSVVDTDPAGSLSLSVAQAIARETAGSSAPSGDTVTLSDTAANLKGLTAAQIGGLKAIGVTAIAATNASVSLTSAQAVALETAGLKVSAPSGDTMTLSDTAANIKGLTAAQIGGLKAIGITSIAATNASVSVSVAQAVALETAGLKVSAPTGDVVTLSDIAANIKGLTASQIGGLKAIGVTAIAATNASVSLTSAQALALETAGLKASALSGDTVTLSDTAANIKGLTAAQIGGLKAIGITSIAATNASVSVSVAQAVALETAGLKVSAPTGDVVTLSDTAANIKGLTAAQIGGLKAIGVTAIAATNASVSLTSAQALALETAGLKASAPSGDVVTLSDTAANIKGLTAAQIGGLKAIGVTAIAATNASVSLTSAQVVALETAGLKASAPSGDAVTLSDTAANIKGLTAAQIGGLKAIGVTAIAATNASVSLTSAQALALETAGLKASAPSGDTVTLSDTAANIKGLTAAQIGGLKAIGVTAIAATNASVSVSVAQVVALETAGLKVSAPTGDVVTLSDTTTNEDALTAAQITGLKAIGVTVVAANASVAMTVAQAIGVETIGLKISAPTGDVVTLSDTAANIDGLTAAQIGGLKAIGVTAIVVNGSATLTSAQAEALETAGLKVSDPTLSDTAANIESLTATEIGRLDAIGVTAIAVTNGSVSFSVAQAIALETEALKVTVPTSDFVTLSDKAANIEKLTSTQIAGLAGIGVTAIAATDASVSLSVAQTSAVNTAGLSVSAPANDAVTEHNADGSYDTVYSGITGQAYTSYQSDYNSAGVLVAQAVNDTNGAGVTTVYGNNLKISTSAGAESLTSGSDIFVYTPHAQETFSAAGTTNDVFTFKAGFGSDTISGLGAAGANADSLNLAGLFTSYASLQSHMVASGSNTIITDAGGDKLTIVALSPSALTAARVGF